MHTSVVTGIFLIGKAAIFLCEIKISLFFQDTYVTSLG